MSQYRITQKQCVNSKSRSTVRKVSIAADVQGGVMIITGLVSMFLLLLFFALSIDHGRNYVHHADLDAKVKNLSLHLAEEWAGFRQKEATAKTLSDMGLKWERSEKDIEIAKKNGVLWELPEPFGPLNEARAKQLISQRMLQLIRKHPGLKRTSLVEVEEDCNSQNRMLLRFAAKIPMSEQFVRPDDKANTSCLSPINPLDPQPEDGCTLVTHTVALGIGCSAGSIPPSDPPDDSGGGSCTAAVDGDFPHMVTGGSGGDAKLSDGGKVMVVVKSLDLTSANSLIDANNVVEVIRKVAGALNIPDEDIAAGSVLGNTPVASPGNRGIKCEKNGDIGWSGGCYDTSEGFEGDDFMNDRKASVSRKHSFVGTFLAQHVRTCEADPVWTYEAKKAGDCWEEARLKCTAGGWNAKPCCEATYGRNTIIDWGNRGSYSSKNICGRYNDKWENKAKTICAEENKITQQECMVRDWEPVYQGQWYAACPISPQTSPEDVYKEPVEFVSVTAHYSRKLDDGEPKHDVGIPPVASSITPLTNKGVLASQSDDNQWDELEPLKKYNTDKSWIWACGTDPLGLPYGRLANRPLVNQDESDIIYPDADCQLPSPPYGGLREYLVEFKRPGCDNPFGSGCDIPEGFYRIELEVSGLRGPRKANGRLLPAGEKNTNWVYKGTLEDDGWAYQKVATVPVNGLGKECPVISGKRGYRKYKTSYSIGANGNHAKYVLDVPDSDGIVVDELPEEHLNVASFNMERRRVSGKPQVCLFDKGDDNLSGSAKDNFVEGAVKGVPGSLPDSYPWFASDPLTREHPFWSNSSRGILAFSGNNEGSFLLGVEEKTRYLTHKDIDGKTDTNFDNDGYGKGIRNLLQLQAMDVVRWMNSDYPPANVDVSVGGLYKALDIISVPYDKFDIHGGHDANQCALMKAGAQALIGNPVGKDALPDERVLIYVGSCPKEDWSNTKFNGLDVNWHAGGNRAGKLSGFQLQALETPYRGTNLRTNTAQCFDQLAATVGNVFIITSGEECREFAQNASKSASSDMCPVPYCVLGVDSDGDCVNRLFSCIRKRATGGG